ncbi:MAG: hypothetical protein JW873_00300, partial [Candidatus Saganbacteria bacterium]|nr:hypothetical protein [Candidatus Saganbacteria bacterium]
YTENPYAEKQTGEEQAGDAKGRLGKFYTENPYDEPAGKTGRDGSKQTVPAQGGQKRKLLDLDGKPVVRVEAKRSKLYRDPDADSVEITEGANNTHALGGQGSKLLGLDKKPIRVEVKRAKLYRDPDADSVEITKK